MPVQAVNDISSARAAADVARAALVEAKRDAVAEESTEEANNESERAVEGPSSIDITGTVFSAEV